MKTKALAALAVISACAFILAVVSALGGWSAADRLKTESRTGFEVSGMYELLDEDGSGRVVSLAILEHENDGPSGTGIFQITSEGEVAGGSFARGADPNLLILSFDEGRRQMAHVAYSTGPKDGLIYVYVDENDVLTFLKVQGRPAFVAS